MRISGRQNEDHMECLQIGGNHSLKGVGWDSIDRIVTALWVGWSGDRFLVRVRFSASILTGCGVHPVSYTMGTVSFQVEKCPGCGIDQSLPSSTEVAERVELYLYSTWAFVACYKVNFTVIFYEDFNCIQKLYKYLYITLMAIANKD
jgi:hypothetical protein